MKSLETVGEWAIMKPLPRYLSTAIWALIPVYLILIGIRIFALTKESTLDNWVVLLTFVLMTIWLMAVLMVDHFRIDKEIMSELYGLGESQRIITIPTGEKAQGALRTLPVGSVARDDNEYVWERMYPSDSGPSWSWRATTGQDGTDETISAATPVTVLFIGRN